MAKRSNLRKSSQTGGQLELPLERSERVDEAVTPRARTSAPEALDRRLNLLLLDELRSWEDLVNQDCAPVPPDWKIL